MTIPSGPYIAEPHDASDPVLRESSVLDQLKLNDTGLAETVTIQSLDGTIEVVSTTIGSDSLVRTSAMQAAPTKATPIDDDGVVLIDSAASNAIKRTLWSAVKATLKTYFDTLYQAVLTSGTNIKTVNGSSLLGSGDLTVSGGLGSSFTKAQLNTAISDGNAVYVGDALNGSLGATTPSTVAATTVSASGTVTAGSQISLNGVQSGIDYCNVTLGQWNLRSDNGGQLKVGRFSGGNTYFTDNTLNVNTITGLTSFVLPLTNLAGRPFTIGQQSIYSDNSTGDFILYDNINARNYLRINRDTALWNITASVTASGTITGGIAATPGTFAVVNATTATATLGLRRITDRGSRLAYPDGTNWRFVSDDAIIS